MNNFFCNVIQFIFIYFDEFQVVFLPEGCDYIASSRQESLLLAEDSQGPFLEKIKNLAKDKNVWLSLGGIHLKVCIFTEDAVENCTLSIYIMRFVTFSCKNRHSFIRYNQQLCIDYFFITLKVQKKM